MSSLYDDVALSGPDHVRLLNVAPSTEFDDPLICTLSVASLAEVNDNYVTLSYCWGSPDRGSPIQVNGVPYHITKELALALRSIRAIENGQPIWVDQLSISQVDDQEKSQQLLLMTQIFSGASTCICYLGEDDGKVDQAIEYMEMALEEIKSLPTDHQRQTTLPPETSDLLYNAPGKAAFMSLANRRYFRRRWIVQETVLSQDPTGICGHRFFSMEAFFFVLAFTVTAESDRILRRPVSTNLDHHRFDEPPALSHHYLRNQFGQAARHFKPLLIFTTDADVTDVRDLFFAIHGLALDSDDFPNPDYSWDVGRTFREFTVGFVNQGFGLWCLQQAHRNCYPGMPSWVPDWRRITRWPQLSLIPEPNFQSVMQVDPDSKILELSCLKLTKITQCTFSSDVTGPTDAAAFSSQALSSLELLFSKFTPDQTPEHVLKRLATVVIKFTHEHYSEDDTMLTCRVLATAAYHQEHAAKAVEEKSTPFLLVKLVFERFQVALTCSGLICVAPFEVKEGDELVLPEGGEAAIAVRHVEPGHHKYIGMAWVENLSSRSDARADGGGDDDTDASTVLQYPDEENVKKYEKVLLV
ncbi:hypothetical protein RBB50_008877 [Rhinocladiella similis]